MKKLNTSEKPSIVCRKQTIICCENKVVMSLRKILEVLQVVCHGVCSVMELEDND